MQKLFKKNHINIGILGGSFDPPHKGHLHISNIALKKLKLDSLMWVVAKQNPFKKKPHLSTKKRNSIISRDDKKTKKNFSKIS